MLSRSKKAKATDLSQRSEMYLDSKYPKNKQFKILSIVGMISVILLLLLYKFGLFSSGKSATNYIIGSRTQALEESTNKILSAWGSAGEALKFANLPSTAQGYLTVKAMVQQQDHSAKRQNIEIFYREASKLNPGGLGIANKLRYQFLSMKHKTQATVSDLGRIQKGLKPIAAKADEDMDAFVIDKDITLIFLHGGDMASSTWEELGTLDIFAQLGYKVYGIDMPGFGHSQKVTVKTNDWLADVIIKLLSSQDEEGNVDRDGGEHHTDSHDDNKDNVVHKIAIISPDISGLYTLDLVDNHEEKLGLAQGLLLEKFIPIAMKRTIRINEIANDVKICSIVGTQDIDAHNEFWEKIENVQTIEIYNAGKHVYIDEPETLHAIIANFLATDKCEYNINAIKNYLSE